MLTNNHLATRFARNTRVLRTDRPLDEDQMRAAAPSVFAEGKHASRSERYTYIPTIEVLRGLRKEGFEPFMVAQGTRLDDRLSGMERRTAAMAESAQSQTVKASGCRVRPPRCLFEPLVRGGAAVDRDQDGLIHGVCLEGAEKAVSGHVYGAGLTGCQTLYRCAAAPRLRSVKAISIASS